MNARVLQLFLGLGTLLILAPAGGLSLPVQAGESHSFSRDIQPLLAKHCVLCHGPDDDSAGLRLDQHDRALAVLESGQRAIVPGQPEASALLQRVSATDPAVSTSTLNEPLGPVTRLGHVRDVRSTVVGDAGVVDTDAERTGCRRCG